MKYLFPILFSFTFLSFGQEVVAQKDSLNASKFQGSGRPQQTGRFYGKIVDESNGKGLEFAPVSLWQSKSDSLTHKKNETLITGQLTEHNGDFSFENVPGFGTYILKVQALGYEKIERPVSFDIKPGGSRGGGGMGMKILEKDLGNLTVKINSYALKEVTVDASAPGFKMDIDKKVYSVDKNSVVTGGTAEDVLKNVPSVSVDLDGNVTVRNSSPQIFVDGRPTTLTIEQIPADAIESIEVITNPSAKYDASGGGAGILNIVLKKERRIGYNGNIRGGIDMRARASGNLDFNIREHKLNFFLGGNYMQRKSIGTTVMERYNLYGNPKTNIFQDGSFKSIGFFGSGRIGADYFMDNRNTITASGSYSLGSFTPTETILNQTDTVFETTSSSSHYTRMTDAERSNVTLGTALLYKHLFPKNGKEFTADANYQNNNSINNGVFSTQDYSGSFAAIGLPKLQKQDGAGVNSVLTVQSDFTNPLTEKSKMETGVRFSIKDFDSRNDNYLFDYTSNEFKLVPSLTSNYRSTDNVYGGYITFTNRPGKFGYQFGLRAESSDYKGEIPDSNLSFRNYYPISFFPNTNLSYTFNEKNDLQLSLSRRVNRPGFYQLIPFTDYSDSLNLRRGNPELKPEFTYSSELNFQHNFGKGNNFIASTYYKRSYHLMTSYQVTEFDSVVERNAIIGTYENANSSQTYGIELTSRNLIMQFMDITTNVNFYQSEIDGTNIQRNLKNTQFSWFLKENLNVRLGKGISCQVSGDYQSRTAMPSGGGGGGMRFMGGYQFSGGMSSSSVQGYVLPRYGVDLGIKYEFLKNRAASITFNVQDVFKTKKYNSYSESSYFKQNSYRTRDQQFFRLNFSYRFGKFDTSLFRRKNNRTEGDEGGI